MLALALTLAQWLGEPTWLSELWDLTPLQREEVRLGRPSE